MFGYVLVIFQVGRMLTDSLSKQRGRQVDLNECSPRFSSPHLLKKIVIMPVNGARLYLGFAG